MKRTLVVGAGLAGCTAALELADNGREVVLLEKSRDIGGKVRSYGCKAVERCTNCGLCIVGDLWERVLDHEKINVLTEATLLDISGNNGDFTAVVRQKNSVIKISEINSVITAIGFDAAASRSFGNLDFERSGSVITGSELESLLAVRTNNGLLGEAPGRVAFIQCFGSRDRKVKAAYCSRVCCGYSTRAARVLAKYYPETEIYFFYMDLQWVENTEYFKSLSENNIRFIRSRPVRIKSGKPAAIVFENPQTAENDEAEFDLIILSEGIHPAPDTERIAEVCTLGVDDNGFLKYVSGGDKTGIYMAGCASGPKSIEEASAEALTVARRVLAQK